MNTKETAQHTPGPWRAVETNFEGSCIFLIKNESGQITIAETDNSDADEQCIANAKLIASAPRLKAENEEMLAMLKALANRLASIRIESAMSLDAEAQMIGEIDAINDLITKLKG